MVNLTIAGWYITVAFSGKQQSLRSAEKEVQRGKGVKDQGKRKSSSTQKLISSEE
jgi:hypothetical protein